MEAAKRMTLPTSDTSWRAFYEAEGARLLLFARQQTRSEADALDVMQDAFLKIWKTRERRGEINRAQMFAEIRRAAIDLARRSSRRERREEAGHDLLEGTAGGEWKSPWFACPVEANEARSALAMALEALPAEQQEVLVLKIWGDLTFEEIGRLLQVSPNTAASRYRYGLKTLKRNLNRPSPKLL